jgi:hypothetical protein
VLSHDGIDLDLDRWHSRCAPIVFPSTVGHFILWLNPCHFELDACSELVLHSVMFGIFTLTMTIVKRSAGVAHDRQRGETPENWALRAIMDRIPPVFDNVFDIRDLVDGMFVLSPHTLLRALPVHEFTIPNTELKGSGDMDVTIRHVQPINVISAKTAILYAHGGTLTPCVPTE